MSRSTNPKRIFLASTLTLFAWLATVATQAIRAQETAPASAITLEQIMADPDWIGLPAEDAYWADDSQSIYYRIKRVASERYDWRRVDLQGNILQVLELSELSQADAPAGEFNRNRWLKVYARNDDIFVKNLKDGQLKQLTRSVEKESDPRFLADGRGVMFRRGDAPFVRDLRTGLEYQLLDLRLEKDPKEARQKAREGFLPEQQQRLFDTLRKQQKDADAARELADESRDKDSMRVGAPWYLGDEFRIDLLSPSPDGRRCLVSLAAKDASDGDSDKMPRFVHQSGYVDVHTVRTLVGTGKPVSEKLLLLQLPDHTQLEINFADLPGLADDPLAEVRKENKTADDSEDSKDLKDGKDKVDENKQSATQDQAGAGASKSKKPRTISVSSIRWTADGRRVVVELFSDDHKDHWLATLDDTTKKLNTIHHHRDPAWINWRVGRVDWLPDNQSVYYTSEESGYAHLYIYHAPSNATRQLTSGTFEVSDVEPSPDGRYLYFTANRDHPGIYESYRVDVKSGNIEQLTRLGGQNRGQPSPDQKHLLITHSTALHPPELWIQPLGAGEPRQITQTVSTAFQSLPWVAPRFVTVPSRAGRPIHARLYLPPKGTAAKSGARPAVIFIHGAGYLQNAHQGWSNYFREFMFHSLLAHRGFVVLDMDYRASAGYGRDWRTAIYRHMGGPEVEDLEDGRQWLMDEHGVDGEHVGLYGGSYGGFLTMMALFQKPGMFACGAALRPVTDWAHYNHGYTSRILNTPKVDPLAYQRSSPIELAAGLADPLLICHGMVDDNVFFKDTARLAQRLIELKKENWEVAVYPVEAHAFTEPTSWLDEYRRVLKLFEQNLRQPSKKQ